MTMTRVKEFSEAMLREIDGFERESVANVLLNMDALVDPSAADNSQVAKNRSDVLLRYESIFAVHVLRSLLNKHLKDTTPVSEESLKPFADFLMSRFDLVKNTNGLYMHSTHSVATLSLVALAKRLFNTLNPLVESSGREARYKHYYDYLFPGFLCSKFVPPDGHLGDYQLNEFFLSEDGRPVPIMASLEAYRIGGKFRPPCIFLTPEERRAGETPLLSRYDTERLTSHSSCAKDYFFAVSAKKPFSELESYKMNLIERAGSPGFVPGCTYADSNSSLIANGFLKVLDVRKLTDFADLLYKTVTPEDWRAFVAAIPEAQFDEVVLPKLPNGEPDVSLVNPDKFEAFVNKDAWYVPGESLHNYAVILLLAEFYHKKRIHEPKWTGTVSNFTSGYVGGLSRGAKLDAVGALLDFVVRVAKKEFCPNQVDAYLKKYSMMEAHGAAIKSDRLLFLVNKLNYLWDKLLADSKKQDNADLSDSLHSPALSLKYDTNSLARDAMRLCQANKGEWSEVVKSFKQTALAGYIKSCGGFYSCVTKQDHYIKGNEAHNRAVLYIMTDYYIRSRSDGDEHGSQIGKFFGAPAKGTKLLAAEEGLLEFFRSDKPLNHLPEHLEQRGLLSIIKEYSLTTSKTKLLAETAEAVCTPKFFEPRDEHSLTASVSKSVTSYLGWK